MPAYSNKTRVALLAMAAPLVRSAASADEALPVPTTAPHMPTTALHIVNATEPQVIKPELAVVLKGCIDTTAAANAALD